MSAAPLLGDAGGDAWKSPQDGGRLDMAATKGGGMTANWPAWKAMNWLRLMEGPHDLTVLPIAPTMKTITYRGETYNRMPNTRSPAPSGEDGEGLTGYGGAYLWDGWWEQKLAEAQAKSDPCGGGPS